MAEYVIEDGRIKTTTSQEIVTASYTPDDLDKEIVRLETVLANYDKLAAQRKLAIQDRLQTLEDMKVALAAALGGE